MPSAKSGRELTFLQGIVEDKFETDEQTAVAIYGNEPKDYAYAMLKNRLKRKLMNHLFFFDLEKAVFLSKMLRKKGSFELAERWVFRRVEPENPVFTHWC